jgi:ATP-dependent phosphoenolpyruvate carboxykinase
MWCWWNGVLSGERAYYVNPCHSFLVEKTIQKRQGILSSNGSLIIEHQDKTSTTKENYVLVRDEKSEPLLDWSKNIRVIDAEKFFNLKTEVLKRIHLIKPELFILENEILINSGSVVGLNLVTTSPATALFLKLILKEKTDNKSIYICHHCLTYTSYFKYDMNRHLQKKNKCELKSIYSLEEATKISTCKKYIFMFDFNDLSILEKNIIIS